MEAFPVQLRLRKGHGAMILNIPDEDEFIQELADLFDTPLISEARYQRVLDLFSGYRMEVKKVEVQPEDFGWVVPKKREP